MFSLKVLLTDIYIQQSFLFTGTAGLKVLPRDPINLHKINMPMIISEKKKERKKKELNIKVKIYMTKDGKQSFFCRSRFRCCCRYLLNNHSLYMDMVSPV